MGLSVRIQKLNSDIHAQGTLTSKLATAIKLGKLPANFIVSTEMMRNWKARSRTHEIGLVFGRVSHSSISIYMIGFGNNEYEDQHKVADMLLEEEKRCCGYLIKISNIYVNKTIKRPKGDLKILFI